MENNGRYIYGVADCGRTISLGAIGIGGNEVYTVSSGHLCAIVHCCSAQPYQSVDEGAVKLWVMMHQRVLDEAGEQLGTVIPAGFDTILYSKDDAISPDQVVRDWLKQDSERLQPVIEKVRGRDEYAVQIFYVPGIIASEISEDNEEIRKLREEMAAKPPGTAYLYRQKLERAVKAQTETLANSWFRSFYTRVKHHCDDIVVEKTRRADGNRVMLLNLSCLVARGKVDELGEELEKINSTGGFPVHFSGPWPPYSFVGGPVMLVKEEIK